MLSVINKTVLICNWLETISLANGGGLKGSFTTSMNFRRHIEPSEGAVVEFNLQNRSVVNPACPSSRATPLDILHASKNELQLNWVCSTKLLHENSVKVIGKLLCKLFLKSALFATWRRTGTDSNIRVSVAGRLLKLIKYLRKNFHPKCRWICPPRTDLLQLWNLTLRHDDLMRNYLLQT
jgi:hypothetical protein